MSACTARIGVISDTHGLLRPEACAALLGCDPIIHAGDIGSQAVLDALSALAPVIAVRGNNDAGPWAERLPEARVVRIDDTVFYVLHDLSRIPLDVAVHGARVVVSGHSHKPLVRRADGVLYVNPGSAGPRRFSLPVTVAQITISGDEVSARIVDLALEKTLSPRDRSARACRRSA